MRKYGNEGEGLLESVSCCVLILVCRVRAEILFSHRLVLPGHRYAWGTILSSIFGYVLQLILDLFSNAWGWWMQCAAVERTSDILGGILYILLYVISYFFSFVLYNSSSLQWKEGISQQTNQGGNIVWTFTRFVLEAGICCSHLIWRLRQWKLQREAEATGKSINSMESQERVASSITAEDGLGPAIVTTVEQVKATAHLEVQVSVTERTPQQTERKATS